MSYSGGNTIDSKVVELSLDNQNFESNARTSISTLDRLKDALKFDKAYKGFDDINSSIKNVNFGTLTKGIKDVGNGFQKLVKDTFVFTTVNKAVSAIEDKLVGMAKSMSSIEQFQAGWNKYAEKTSAVQTIMSATAGAYADEATQMEEVNKQLEKLNWFTDETSFNFVDMTSNIGKFTSNNVELKDAVTAMEGISTWAAKSGATIPQASHAMYNLSQAIATGAVRLTDWKSIETANMATAEFKQTAIDTAVSLGTLTKVTDDLYRTTAGHDVSVTNFNDNLKDEWFTSKVLIKSLDKYGGFADKLHNSIESLDKEISTSKMLEFVDGYVDSSIDWNEAMIATGLSMEELRPMLEELSSEELAFGRKAFAAAQEAKTFEEAINSVKDAVSTGWMNTYELMFGDYLQAKKLWTTLAEDLYDIFAEGGNARNSLLKDAFSQTDAITSEEWSKITNAGLASPAFVKAVLESAQAHNDAVIDIEGGKKSLVDALNSEMITIDDLNAAYNKLFATEVDSELAKQVQATKETDEEFKNLFDTVSKYSSEDLDKVIFGDGSYAEGYEELERNLDSMLTKLGLAQDQGGELVKVLKGESDGSLEVAKSISELSDAELIQLGFTEQNIQKLRESIKEGKSASEAFAEIGMVKKTGGELWTETLYNGMEAIVKLVKVVRDAWADIFPPATASQVYNFLKALHSGSESLLNFISTSQELKDILHGVFSAFDILFGLIMGLGRGAIGIITGLLDSFGINLLEIAANIANVVTSVRNWINQNKVIERSISAVTGFVNKAAKAIKKFDEKFKFKSIVPASENLKRFQIAFQWAFKQIGPYLEKGKERLSAFGKKVEEMGGLNFGNFGDVLKMLKDEVLEYIANFPGFKYIKAAWDLFIEDMRTKLAAVGIDLDVIINFFKALGNVGQMAFGFITDSALGAVTKVGELIDKFTNLPKVKENLARFKNGFTQAFTKLPELFKGGSERISKFTEDVKAMGGLNLGNFGEVAKMFKDDVLDYIANFPGFDGLKKSFKLLWSDIKSGLKGWGIDVDGITEKFVAWKDTLMENIKPHIDNFSKAFTEAFNNFPDFIETIKEKFGEFKEKIGELDGISLDNISEVWDAFKETVLKGITDFEGFDSLIEAFEKLKTDISTKLSEAGLTVDGLINKFTELKTFVDEHIKSLFAPKEDTKTDTITKPIEDAEKDSKSLFDTIKENIEGVIQKFEELKTKVTETFDSILVPEPIAKALEFFTGNEVLGLSDALEAVGKIFDTISTKYQEFKSSLGGIGKLVDPLATVASVLLSFKMFGVVKKSVETVTGGITGVTSSLSDLFATTGAVIKSVGGVFGNLTSIIGEMSNVLKAQQKELKAKRLLEIAAAIGILVAALVALTFIDTNKLIVAVGAIAALALILGVLAGALAKVPNSDRIQSIGIGLLAMSASLLLLVGALKLMESLKVEQLSKTVPVLVGMFLGLVVVAGLLSKFAGKATASAGLGVMSMVASMYLLLGLLKVLDKFKLKNPVKVVGKLVMVLGAIVALLLVAKIGGKTAGGAAGSILAISGAMILLGLALKIIESIDDNAMMKCVVLLGAIALAIGGLMVAAKGLKGSAVSVIAIAGVIIVIAQTLKSLAKVDKKDLASARDALMGVGAVFALLSGVTGLFKTSFAPILAMTVLVAAIAGLIWALVQMREHLNEIMPIMDKIQTFIIALSACTVALGLVGSLGPAALIGVASAILLVAGLAGVVGLMGDFVGSGVEKAFSHLPAMGGYMAEFAAGMVPFAEAMQSIPEGSFNGVRDLAQSLKAVVESEISDSLYKLFKGESAITTYANQLPEFARGMNDYAAALSNDIDYKKVEASTNAIALLATLTADVLPDTGLVGFLNGSADKISSFSTQLPLLASGLSAYANKIDASTFNEDKINASADLIELLSTLTKEVIPEGGLIGWVQGNDTKIKDFGSQLTTLATGLHEYVTSINDTDFNEDKIKASENLVKLLSNLANEDIPDGGIFNFIYGNDTKIANFSTQLPQLAAGLADYMSAIDDTNFSAKKVRASTNLAKLLANLAKHDIPSDSAIMNFLEGNSTKITTFGGQLKDLATGLAEYVSVIDDTTFNTKKVNASTNLAKLLASLANETIPDGGIFNILNGNDTKITNFGKQLPILANGLKDYANAIKDAEFDPTQIASSKSLAQMLSALTTEDIPDGGIFNIIEGNDTKIAAFGTQLPVLAEGLSGFVDNLTGDFTGDKVGAATSFAQILSALSVNLPKAGLAGFLTGDSGKITQFADNLPELARGLSEYSNALTGKFNATQIANSGRALNSISKFIAVINDTGWYNAVANYGTALTQLASNLGDFAELMSGITGFSDLAEDLGKIGEFQNSIGTLDAFTKAIKKAKKAVEGLAELDDSGVDKLIGDMEKIDTGGVAEKGSEIGSAFAESAAGKTDQVLASGRVLGNALSEGIGSKSGAMTSAAGTLVDGVLGVLTSRVGEFTPKGAAITETIASGIKGSDAASTAVGEIVTKAANAVNSSDASSKFQSAGSAMMSSFETGVRNKGEEIIRYVNSLASRIRSALSNAQKPIQKKQEEIDENLISSVDASNAYIEQTGSRTVKSFELALAAFNTAIQTKIDTEPVIRPVLDISDIEIGANAIRDTLAKSAAIGLNGNIAAISNNMTREEDRTDEIIEAINTIGKNLADGTGDTYILDGITYDDGSNVAGAIKTLVNSIKMRRRV